MYRTNFNRNTISDMSKQEIRNGMAHYLCKISIGIAQILEPNIRIKTFKHVHNQVSQNRYTIYIRNNHAIRHIIHLHHENKILQKQFAQTITKCQIHLLFSNDNTSCFFNEYYTSGHQKAKSKTVPF